MSGQTWSAADYARNGAFVPALGEALIAWLEPRCGERILDLGCGDGALTQRLADTGASVVGIDASPSMVEAARARGLDARLCDARELPYDREFDAAFSNAALHWMPEPDRVLAGVARALRPAGRFVGELGGKGNVAAIVAAVGAELERAGIDASARFPWYFPSADEYAARLRDAGFTILRIERFERPTPLPGSLEEWLATFGQPFFSGLDAATTSALCTAVAARLAPELQDERGIWIADYVRVRFFARARSVEG